MSDYLKLSTEVDRHQADDLSQLLQACGCLAVSIEAAAQHECYDAALPSEPRWPRQKVTGLFARGSDAGRIKRALHHHAPNFFADALPSNAPLAWQESYLVEQDWPRASLAAFKPLKITPQLTICPSWCTPTEPTPVTIRIDPGLAFGSGSHATTALCLAQLSALSTGGWLSARRVVDFGCGSGILAIAAVKLGASAAVAVDIDANAVTACRQNAAQNRVAAQVVCQPVADFLTAASSHPGADLVLANMLAVTLVEQAATLKALCRADADAKLMLSGILSHQREQVIAHFPEFVFQQQQQEEWLLLLGQRQSP